jgi:hypothetical protein
MTLVAGLIGTPGTPEEHPPTGALHTPGSIRAVVERLRSGRAKLRSGTLAGFIPPAWCFVDG